MLKLQCTGDLNIYDARSFFNTYISVVAATIFLCILFVGPYIELLTFAGTLKEQTYLLTLMAVLNWQTLGWRSM